MKRIVFCLIIVLNFISCTQKHVNETSANKITSQEVTETVVEDTEVYASEHDSISAPLTKLGGHDVFVRVSAVSDGDGVIDIFHKPDTASRIEGELCAQYSGVLWGKLLEYGKEWCRIETEDATGYVQTKDVLFESMVNPDAELFLIAAKTFKLHTICHSDGADIDFFYRIQTGTIIYSCDQVLDEKNHAGEIYIGDVVETQKDYVIKEMFSEDIIKKTNIKVVERTKLLNNK